MAPDLFDIRLTGKVELLMCLTWSFGAPTAKNTNFLQVIHNFLQTNVHRNFDCSARYQI